ncbi:MAG: hypothetical protein E6G97_22145 [Alphaproteobacteria bacterium]|nr:MAG: hypothetical protein E6G97_22145 [Alphaproteobacteria bacterium]
MPTHVPARASIRLVAALAIACQANAASAQLSLFQTEVQAKQHCPNDTVVWADFQKRVYYTAGQRLYAQGRTGTFVCRNEARRSGYRRSVLGRR